MMRAISPFLEKHHQVMITDDALSDAVRLSHRYITGRQLPDKSVSVLDTACARVAIGLTTNPPPMEDISRRMGEIDREIKILEKEVLMGRNHKERIDGLTKEKKEAQVRLDELDKKWKKEMEVANRITDARKEIEELHEKDPADKAIAQKQKALKNLEKELAKVQGDTPLVQIAVDGQIVSEVISGWTGIPTGVCSPTRSTRYLKWRSCWAKGSSGRTMRSVPLRR